MAKGRKLPNFLRGNEVDALLQTAQAQLKAAKSDARRRARRLDMALLQVGLGLGLRVAELADLKIEHVDLGQRTVLVFQGKGGKDRLVPINSRLCPLLAAWADGRSEGFLFCSPRGGRLSPRTIQVRLAALGAKAGLPRRLKPHTLRHTFATRLLEKGANIREVQELLGHSSVATTEIYTHTVPERLRGAVEKL